MCVGRVVGRTSMLPVDQSNRDLPISAQRYDLSSMQNHDTWVGDRAMDTNRPIFVKSIKSCSLESIEIAWRNIYFFHEFFSKIDLSKIEAPSKEFRGSKSISKVCSRTNDAQTLPSMFNLLDENANFGNRKSARASLFFPGRS